MFAFACVGMVGLLDMCVARWFGAARYFALHVAVNIVTTYFAFKDFLFVLTSPNPFSTNSCANAGIACSNKLPLDLTVGIHLWHSLAYALKPIDWVHHIPAHLVCAVGILFPWGPSMNALCIILMGVPFDPFSCCGGA